MRARSSLVARLAALAAVSSLFGCGSRSDTTVEIVAIGERGSLFGRGGRLSSPDQLLRAATTQGLVAFDEKGRVVPALADRWIVLDDGQSYIFRLRDGAWRNGRPITGQAARAALREAIVRLKGTPLALDLAEIDDIRAMAGRVLEIRLKQPMPDLLQLLAQPELGLTYRGSGAGPMEPTRAGDTVTLVPIAPERLGLPAIAKWESRVRSLTLVALRGEEAVRRFSRGESDIVLGGRVEQFPLAGALGIGRGAIRLDPVLGLFGMVAVKADGLLATAETREAIAMSIDREALVRAFGVSGWTPSTRIVPAEAGDAAGIVGERWSDIGLDERRRQARIVVERWRQEGSRAAASPRLSLALPKGPGSDLIFESLRQDFATIGVAAFRVDEDADVDLRLVDENARYARAAWFLNRFNCGARHSLCDPGADALMDQVRATPDAGVRARLLSEAAASLTAANVFIPIASAPLRWSLVRGDAIGFAANRIGWHPLMPMALRPK